MTTTIQPAPSSPELAPGNAIQVGLMALAGYFDAETICGVPIPYRYAPPDWRVIELHDLGPKEFYRYRVVGENFSTREDEANRRFCWLVPDLNWRFFWTSSEAVYWSVIVPFVEGSARSEWHPTDSTFAPISRGAFPNVEAAIAWAHKHLGSGAEFTLRAYPLPAYAHLEEDAA